MMILGIILILAGIISIVVGVAQNNDLASQIESIFSGSGANPGDIWIIIGVVALIVGVVLLIVGFMKKNKSK